MIDHLYRTVEKPALWLWLTLIALLPITSMPAVAAWLGSSSVASPAVPLLALFTLMWVVPALMRGVPLYAGHVILLIFFCLTAGLSLLQNLNSSVSFKNFAPSRAQLETILTLLIGVSFYLAAALFTAKPRWMRLTLMVINFSGLVVILWCLVQAGFWHLTGGYPDWLRDLQGLISLGPMFRGRVTGFALEPSWLAHQLNMLYLPLWLAAVLAGHTSHKRLPSRLTIEMLLLGLGLVCLLLSLSRAGYLAIVLMAILPLVLIARRLVRFVQGARNADSRKIPAGLIYGALGLTAAGLVWVFLTQISRLDPRMAEMFKFDAKAENPLLAYANNLLFSSRAVYWQAGWRIFDAHPWLGVGLGMAGFDMPAALSGYAFRLVEVQTLLYHSHTLLNIKSFWVRLLAETGIVGFSLFVVWLVQIGRYAIAMISERETQMRMMAYFGVLVLLAFLIEGFSIDSFAMPYLWVSCGLVTATWMRFRRKSEIHLE